MSNSLHYIAVHKHNEQQKKIPREGHNQVAQSFQGTKRRRDEGQIMLKIRHINNKRGISKEEKPPLKSQQENYWKLIVSQV